MRLRDKLFLTSFIILFLNGFIYGQQVLNIKGVLFRKSSSERISQGVITDLKNQVVMMSDELGGFNIKASPGDTLLITKNNYTPQKIVIINADDLAIYLQP